MTAPTARSLRRRLVLGVSIPLVLFFGITIFALDAVFRNVVDRSMQELLDAQMIGLIAAAEPIDGAGIVAIARTADPRLDAPGSGLYAGIDADEPLWRSASTAGTFIDFGAPLSPGDTRTTRALLPDGEGVVIASRGIAWGDESGSSRDLTFTVATSLAPAEQQVLLFRTQVFSWFAVLTVLLLFILAALLRWTLAPARQLETEIRAVEAGDRESLSTVWPQELAGVAGNLNALLAAERARITRYRHTLGNLAHSLKTPLAVMRSALGRGDPQAPALDHEIDRMTAIIDHQLRRAASGGATVGQVPVPVHPIVADLRGALLRAHARKDFVIENAVPGNIAFVGDPDDLTELLGNLVDNACKWCQSRVRVSTTWDSQAAPRRRLRIVVEDDGAGIADQDRARVLTRGERADERVPGHGLGLAMARDTVELYGGELVIDASPLGGARVTLAMPGRC